MKHTRFSSRIVRCILAAAGAGAVALPRAFAQQAPAGDGPAVGLSTALNDDQRLIAELSRRDLTTLREYMFRKNNIGPEQQASYVAVSSLKQLNNADLDRRQRQELINNIALGIGNVLATINDPVELMKLNKLLVDNGTTRALNTLEYWGENPRTQAQLRPIATAVDQVYAKAITLAQTKADRLANQMTPANQSQLAPEWEKATQLVGLAKFNDAYNHYTLALSIDKADPKRAEVAQEGIKVLTEYEDPQYEIQALARVGIGKLNLAIGTKESLAAAKQKFAEVLADEKAAWAQKYEATYFSAVADVIARNLPAARTGMTAVATWLSANPAPDATLKQATEAAQKMLEYRIVSTEAEMAAGEAAAKANAAAVAILQGLVKQRPDLAGIINEQLVSRLPESPDVATVDPLLLKAVVAHGNDEIARPADQPVDKKVLHQAILAAREVVGRANRAGFANDDAETSQLLLGFFHNRLGQDAEAAGAFLDYLEHYPAHPQHTAMAFDNAAAAVGKLKREQPDARATEDVYLRFLQLATAAPFSRAEFNFEYGRLLLQRNIAQMQGDYSDAQKDQMLATARKAVSLLHSVTEEKQLLHARFFEMLADDQMLDLASGPQAYAELGGRIRALADEINAMIATRLPAATDEAARTNLRWFKVRTGLLVANLAKHDASDDRSKSLEQALKMLANFEQDVQGLPNAAALLGEARFLRVNALMSLGRAEEALDDLGKFLETRSGDEGIQIVYDMLESLNTDYQHALKSRQTQRAAELAAHRARVSSYLVDRVSKSSREEVRKLLPRYKMFEAKALQEAAALEQDPARRKKFLEDALAIFAAAAEANPTDRGIEVDIASVQYDLGNYAAAQPILARMLDQKLLGPPHVTIPAPEGVTVQVNNLYWSGMLSLLRCNVQLVKVNAQGFGPGVLEDTKAKLRDIFIRFPEPGGPRWAPEFNKLREELLPNWSPESTTQPAPAEPTANRP